MSPPPPRARSSPHDSSERRNRAAPTRAEPPRHPSTTAKLSLFLSLGTAAISLHCACTSTPRHPKPLEQVSINDGENAPVLGTVLNLDLGAREPTALRAVIDFSITDRTIVDGIVVPSQGLVLTPKQPGTTSATLRTEDGKERTITIVVVDPQDASAPPDASDAPNDD